MSDATGDGEEDFRNQTKYKQFSSAIDRALKVFELSTEWHDLISSLAKLHKVLLAYMQYPVVPNHLTVCKRLTQCLHPNLPSGVHIKTLDVYCAIFGRIGPSGLTGDLLAYSSGLFPLITYSSMAVRTRVVEMYEKYYIPLGESLRPALHGMVLGLLPGLEDASEHTERINRLLDTVCEITDLSFFSSALWECVFSSPEVRVPAANLILSKLDKKLTAEDQVHILGGNLPLMVSAICAGLGDKNVLAVRSLLDVLSHLFPLHQPFLLSTDVTAIMVATLETLLKRDISLNRRLFSWLLGSSSDKATLAQLPKSDQAEDTEGGYFRAYSAGYVQSALKSLCKQAVLATKKPGATKLDCVQPYRLSRALLERAEVGDSLMETVLLDLVSCLKEQVDSLGGISSSQDGGVRRSNSDDHPKKVGRKAALKQEVLQSANLFFNALNPGFLWKWLSKLLETSLTREVKDRQLSVSRSEAEEEELYREPDTVDDGVTKDDEVTKVNSPRMESHPPISPVSLTFDPALEAKPEVAQSAPEDQLSCSYVISLTKFLLKSLPLDSMEKTHLLHLPQLSLTLLSCLLRSHACLASHDLHMTLDLVSCITEELMSSPSSRAATPSTPLSATNRIPPGISPTSTPTNAHLKSPVNGHHSTEVLVVDINNVFLQFFACFVKESVIEGRERGSVFTAACQVLLLLAKLGSGLEAVMEGCEATRSSAPWMDSLITACTLNWESHNHHVTFVAIETLLRLFQLHRLLPDREGFPGERGSSITSAIITGPMVTRVSGNQSFQQYLTECLWSCLSVSHRSCHFEAATLLSWLLQQLSMPSVCETVILEHFTSDGLEAYHSFASLWEHSHRSLPHCTTVLHRCVLRMLEGLKSDSPSIKQFVQSWVTFVLSRKDDLHALLQPLVKILTAPGVIRKPTLDRESEKYRIGMSLSAKDAEKDEAYAKYYYDSLGIPDPLDFAKSGQHCETTCHYSQVIDTGQLLYAISLLQCVVEVDPRMVVGRMGISLVEPGSYTQEGREEPSAAGEEATGGGDGSAARKSLLELVLTLCVDLMRSEYAAALEASLSCHLDNLAVRIASVELLHCLLWHLTRLSADAHSVEGETSTTLSSHFVSALVTLCDVQKTSLLVMGCVIRDLRALKTKDMSREENIWLLLKSDESAQSLEFTLQSFLTQLLLLIYALVAMETQCQSKQAMKLTTPQTDRPHSSGLRTGSDEWLPPVLPSLPTVSQPFLQALILDVLSDQKLSHLHESILQLVSALLPNLLDYQLAELGSKVLKQVCSNLEELSFTSKTKHRLKGEWPGRQTTLYLSSMYAIISWCLFGETRPSPEEERSGYKTINTFWRRLRVVESETQESTLTPTSRQPSAMSWLFSVFSTSSQVTKTLVLEDGGSGHSAFDRSRVGMNSRAGQHVLMLLPAVYNAIAETWRGCGQGSKGVEGSGDKSALRGDVEKRKSALVTQDTVVLLSQLVSSLAHREPSAFFSSISHIWMEWNLGAEMSRRKSKRKSQFIELLHHIQVLPLGGVIDSIQTTLSEIRLADERQSGLLRQKYLLHFLYKYLSCTLQSSEELADCSGQLVMFLREFYNESCGHGTDSLTSNCQILCMLTSILHVVVCRVPAPEAKKQKKERKELQDLIHKLCEALSVAANVSNSQLTLKHHMTSDDNHVTADHKAGRTDEDPSLGVTQSVPATPDAYSTQPQGMDRGRSTALVGMHFSDSELVLKKDYVPQRSKVTHEISSGQETSLLQALAVLSSVLSHFVDCAFEGSEKDKVIALLRAVMGNIWPHLQSHSPENDQSYLYAVKLLSSLSGFQVSRKAWRKEALELFLSTSFFQMGPHPLREWKVVVDNLMTQDNLTFRDLLSRVHPSNTTGVVNIFISVDQEVAAGARLLKRVGFALLSAEADQFVEFLPDIQEKLSEYLKVLRHPPICAVVMLVFRVLLVRFSSPHLMAFWPTITAEMLTLLADLDSDLCTEVSEGIPLSSERLQLYLSVCKLLDTAMALPSDQLPHFQLLRWGFSSGDAYTSSTRDCVISKLCRQFRALGSPTLAALHSHYTPHPTPPYLQLSTVSSLRELKPLFTALSHSPFGKVAHTSTNMAAGSQLSQTDEQLRRLKRIETILLNDFVESHNS